MSANSATIYYGGQAVIEGVMMRGRERAAVAVRDRAGALVIRAEVLPPSLYSSWPARVPLIRGLVQLWEMLILGTRMLLFSAQVQAGPQSQEISRPLLAFTLLFSVAFAVALFFVLPLLAIHNRGNGLLEGVVRLGIFLLYLGVIGRMPRIRRLFQYHGAEHKTINAYEAGAELTPRSVQRFSTLHVRCGTAFLLWVVVLSIILFSLLGHQSLGAAIVSRIVLIPVIAAIGYELLRLAARYYNAPVVGWLVKPGLWLQKLTTREPDDTQVEAAIAALKAVLPGTVQ